MAITLPSWNRPDKADSVLSKSAVFLWRAARVAQVRTKGRPAADLAFLADAGAAIVYCPARGPGAAASRPRAQHIQEWEVGWKADARSSWR